MFSPNLMNSIGVDFKLKNILVDQKRVKLQIWDTAGQERFRTITTSYYKGAQAILIVFDVTDRDTFDHLKNWMADIDKFSKEGVMKVLVGNKCDMTHKRVVNTEEGKQLASKLGIEYVETSAKDSICIEDVFVMATRLFISNQQMNPLKKSYTNFTADGVLISNQTTKDKKKKRLCC